MVQEARELHKHLPPAGRPVVALFVIHQPSIVVSFV